MRDVCLRFLTVFKGRPTILSVGIQKLVSIVILIPCEGWDDLYDPPCTPTNLTPRLHIGLFISVADELSPREDQQH